MGKRIKEIDEYIAQAQPFAQPILKSFRDIIHEACPNCEEKLKWGMPHFDYKGLMMSTASFKGHCILNFWKAALLDDKHQVLEKGETSAMGQLGRITTMDEIPDKSILFDLVKHAAQLNENGIELPKKKSAPKVELPVPDDFHFELAKNEEALLVFTNFPPGQRKEYIEWITGAKREATRVKRIATAVEWIGEGKRRNWKYEKC